MGMRLFHRSFAGQSPIPPGNPVPSHFRILKRQDFPNGPIVLKVRYPDAKNYEGLKILVYRNKEALQKHVNETQSLDLHFDDKSLSPFARFEPTDEGWESALFVAKRLHNLIHLERTSKQRPLPRTTDAKICKK